MTPTVMTGGTPSPSSDATSLSLGMSGLRTLAQLLVQAHAPAGIHVATVTIVGAVAPGLRPVGPRDVDAPAERRREGTWHCGT